MVTIQKGEEGFERLCAVCIPLKYRDGGDGRFPAVIQVEQFDIPDWGEPHFSVREGKTVAVATNGRKQVVAEVDHIRPGQYRLIKRLKDAITLERVETEVPFPNWRKLFSKTVKDGKVFTGGEAPVNKAWEVADSTTYWICGILYSLGKEGFCVDTKFITELVSDVHFRKSAVVIAPCDGRNIISLHFPGMAALIAPLSLRDTCRPFTGARN
jgi:hypothetical protein